MRVFRKRPNNVEGFSTSHKKSKNGSNGSSLSIQHRARYPVVGPNYNCPPFPMAPRGKPSDAYFVNNGFGILNTFGRVSDIPPNCALSDWHVYQAICENAASSKSHPADFTDTGRIRKTRANKGRAAKEKIGDTWFYIRYEGYLLAGDEIRYLDDEDVKQWDEYGDAEPIECVFQDDRAPTNLEVRRGQRLDEPEDVTSSRSVSSKTYLGSTTSPVEKLFAKSYQ